MRPITLSFLSLMTIGQLSASAADYRFEAQEQRATHSPGHPATVEIRLINLGTGQPVANATFVASSLRMPMNTEGSMDASASWAAQQSPNSYRFAVSVPMTGSWLLDLTAKVPGEPGVIHGSVPLYIETAGPTRHPQASAPRGDDQRLGKTDDCPGTLSLERTRIPGGCPTQQGDKP